MPAGSAALRRVVPAAEIDRLVVSPVERTHHALRVGRGMEDRDR